MRIEDFIKHGAHCLAGKYSTMGRCSCGAQAALEELAALREAARALEVCERVMNHACEIGDPEWSVFSGFREAREAIKSAALSITGYPDMTDKDCTWSQDEDGNWNTSCDNIFVLLDETTPSGNDMRYCPYCGSRLVQEVYKAEPDEDE